MSLILAFDYLKNFHFHALYNLIEHHQYWILIAYYKLDEGTGTTISDATGNAPNGIFSNGPTWQVPSTSPLGGPLYSTYLWSPSGETTSSITVSTSGDYSVTVTGNDTDCSSTSSVTNVIRLLHEPKLLVER